MRKFIYYATLFLGSVVILTTLISTVGSEKVWWMKVIDFPRIQLLFAAALLLALFIWVNKRWSFWASFFVMGLVTAILIQIYHVYPYSRLVKPTVQTVSPADKHEESTFSLAVANIYMHNRQAEDFLQIIEENNPDLVLAIEPDAWWEKALQPLNERYPHGMKYILDTGYGMILYSKLPLSGKEIMFLNYEEVPSFHATVTLPGGERFRFHGVHPVPPFPGKPGNGGKEMALKKVGDMVAADRQPAVVAGDLNDVAWALRERLFDQEGLLNDVRIGRAINNTFSAKNIFLRWPLDYVYVTKEFGVVDFRRLPYFGSDHFALYLELSLLKEDQRP